MRDRYRSGLAALAVALGVAACGPTATEEAEDSVAPGVSDETLYAIEGEAPDNEELVSYSIPADELITVDGIGVARPGDTLGDLSAVLGDAGIRLAPGFMPGLSAVCVDDPSGAELFCAAYPGGAQPAEDTVIEVVVTRHPKFRTREGVGPGVALEDIEVVYGDAVLITDARTPGVEQVEFEEGPAGSISFRPLSPSSPDGLAGIYPPAEGNFNETEEYRPDTVIGAVEVRVGLKE